MNNFKTPTTKLKSSILILVLGISLAAGVTFAGWVGTSNMTTGSVITASDIKDNFDYLYDQISNGGATPAGAIMAFNLASCPVGWSEFTNARGRTVVGLSASDAEFNLLRESGGSKTQSLTIAQMPRHRHTLYTAAQKSTGGGPGYYNGFTGTVGLNTHAGNSGYAGSGASHNNLQPYITLLYCQKN